MGLKKASKLKMITLIILFGIIVALFTIASKGAYLKPRNIVNIFNSMSVVALLTVGSACLLISGHIDLSAGAVGGLSALVLAKLLVETPIPLPIAFIIAMLVAAAFGIANAALINELSFPGFITTLAMASVAEGLGMSLAVANSIRVTDPVITYIGTARIGEFVPVSIILALLVFFVYGIILSKSRFGRGIYLIGGNPQAAKLAGLNPKRVSYILFMNSAMLGCLAGILLAGRQKAAMTQGLANNQFAGVTAAILGGVSFGGGSGSMAGAFLGLLILRAFNNGLTTIPGIDPYWQIVASGALLLIALLFDFISLKSRGKKLRGTT
ncbi:MAG: ABC transporter permease [Clostridiales bacterium]|nr:ABC transporter permease [Clostridiales bacterium]